MGRRWTRTAVFLACAVFAGCINAGDLIGSGDAGVTDSGADALSGDGGALTDGNVSGDGAVTIPDLAIYFPFDEGSGSTTTDHGPGAFVGKLDDDVTFVPGHSGTAVSFPGDGGNVFVADEPGLSIGSPATIAFWVNADAVPATDDRLVEMGYAWDIKLNGSDEAPQLTWNEDDASTGLIAPVNGITTGEWHHLAYTFDLTAGAAMYVDGRLQNNGSYDFTPGDIFRKDTYGLTIGSATGGASECKCRIDELRLYTRALDADEIKQLAK